MIKTMQIDFLRAVFQWHLFLNREDTNYFNDNDIKLFSFYESLVNEEEVARYVDTYQKLVEQQDLESYIGLGVLAMTQSPTITNLKTMFISPFEWSTSIRCKLANRDKVLATIYKFIDELKGMKEDVALLDNGKIVPVGTVYRYGDSGTNIYLADYDYIGDITSYESASVGITTLIASLNTKVGITSNNLHYVYVEKSGKLYLYEYDSQHSIWVDTELVPDHESFEKYKLDFAFDNMRATQPFELDGNKYCEIAFGGSCTLTDEYAKLGNDLVRVFLRKKEVVLNDSTPQTFSRAKEEVEPMECPSGNNPNLIITQVRSNHLHTKSHTDSVSTNLTYTFAYDKSIKILHELFLYGRYGINNFGEGGVFQESTITPNIIYEITEIFSSWGTVEVITQSVKLNESVDIENTESDVMTIKLPFQKQGDSATYSIFDRG